ncbi:M1 family metallopeptidase [Embleya sp. NBC_00896]|uniref:M1 family metallopeptidase n=1 Tax=Embleya sp. NBC_00896 TaxID=2975961 RepID=UPI002F919AE9|nr:M1 family metallopeptidase [Embleya sp. NBC_00896]
MASKFSRPLLALVATPVLTALLVGASQGGGATPGAPGAGDPYFPLSGNGGYHVLHYGLDLGYTPATRQLEGTADLTVTATQKLSSFNLDLSGLNVGSVRIDGKQAAFSRSGAELKVTPKHALDRGRKFHVVVTYSGVPANVIDPDGSPDGWIIQPDDSVFVANEPQGAMTWFPSNSHPKDKSTYDVAVTVPDGWTAVSNGRLRDRRSQHGKTTFSWRESQPMAAYLATASIAKFQTEQYVTAGGIPVYNAVVPSQAEEAAPVLAQLPAIIDAQTKLFGKYPFDSAGAIVEDAPDVGYALETQTRPIYDRAPDIDTLVHETAHQWFGNSVSLTKWQDIWLNEGFATYAEWLWDADHGGSSTAQKFADDYALPATDRLWAFPAGDPGDGAHLFAKPPYERGAMVLEKLRQTVGDKDFFAILKAWATDHRYGHGDSAQFIALSEKISGEQLDAMFATWLYGQGKPATP